MISVRHPNNGFNGLYEEIQAAIEKANIDGSSDERVEL